MKAQKADYPDLALNSHLARSRSVNPGSSADTGQKAVEWGAGYCRRLGKAIRHGLYRCIRFHELQTVDSYKWLL